LEEAKEQALSALQVTQGKPLFMFYLSNILFAMKKPKEAIQYLERAMEKAPKLLKRFVELNPSILQNHQVVDMIAKFKRNKSI
jgi:predicted Zn-dependent protease